MDGKKFIIRPGQTIRIEVVYQGPGKEILFHQRPGLESVEIGMNEMRRAAEREREGEPGNGDNGR